TGLASGADAAGAAAEALAEAEAATTLAAGADFATLAAAAAVAGLEAAVADAEAGVCAKALPITTVEAMMAVISLFMIFPLYVWVGLLGFSFRSVAT
ncbi:unnamed protein product, partial [Rotaria sp. Silwood2]